MNLRIDVDMDGNEDWVSQHTWDFHEPGEFVAAIVEPGASRDEVTRAVKDWGLMARNQSRMPSSFAAALEREFGVRVPRMAVMSE